VAAGTRVLTVDLHRVDRFVVCRAAAVLRQGGVLLYPTETVYGLGCSAYNGRAVRRIFAMKRRPMHNPAILLIDSREMLRRLVGEIPPLARILMREFWPGPLTLVLQARRALHPLLLGPGGTVAVRIPGSRFCQRLIAEAGLPLVSTSANISGRPIPADRLELLRLFGTRADLLIDGGDLPRSFPSTVVNLCSATPVILREGAVRRSVLRSFLRPPA